MSEENEILDSILDNGESWYAYADWNIMPLEVKFKGINRDH